MSQQFLAGQNSRICTCRKNRQNFGKNLQRISRRSKFSYMYVQKKSPKFRKKSSKNFSQVKILVYVRAEKIAKISEKIFSEFLVGQNSRICTCIKNRQNFGKNLQRISRRSKFSYMYVRKKSPKFRKKSSENFSQVKILVYVRAVTVCFYQGVIFLWIQVRPLPLKRQRPESKYQFIIHFQIKILKYYHKVFFVFINKSKIYSLMLIFFLYFINFFCIL